ALLAASGAAAGRYTVSFTVRDAAGKAATDTVKLVVAAAATQTLLDQSKTDTMPGASLGAAALITYVAFPFTVLAGLSSFAVTVTWANIANDYDLHIFDPSGAEVL